jgi:ABC-type glutathione transport system ATPase component
MKNVSMEIGKDKVLTIRVDLKQTFGASGSGKSIIIGSTEGNASLDGENSDIKVGLNVYRKA